MECSYCGENLGKKYYIINNNVFCSIKCSKYFSYYILEDYIRMYCNEFGNYCSICPITQECSIFFNIRDKITTNEDILKFEIPIIYDKKVQLNQALRKLIALVFIKDI